MDGPGRGERPARWWPVAVALLLAAVACASPRAEVRPGEHGVADPGAVGAPPDRTPAGEVRVAYPDEPAHFLDLAGDDPAARDLQALWGLPLFRVDPAGQLVAGLVEDWEVADAGEGWAVDLRLRAGRWSDGREVTAADVVATVDALRQGPRADELALLTQVVATDEHGVRLVFDRPYARWWALLDGAGVLPAHVLAEGGLDAFRDAIPVAGGAFSLTERVPGLRTTFAANTAGPLGPPGLELVEVAVVPRYETALGLLRREEVEVVLGHLALNPVERARRVSGVEAAAPVGGTTVGLWWRPDGPGGDAAAAPRRRAVAAAIDVSQLVEGLLGPIGEAATSVVPGIPGPSGGVAGELAGEVGQPTVVVPRWAEAIAFTGRAIQRDLRTAGGGAELVTEEAPDVIDLARTTGDAYLAARRTGPAPSLVGTVHDREAALAGDAGGRGSRAFRDAAARAAEDALAYPLYRVGVAHAWSPAVEGIRPSSWPGLAFWDVSSWVRAGDDGT